MTEEELREIEALFRRKLPWQDFAQTPVGRLVAEVRRLNNRISDMSLGCEVDDVYPGQEEAQTINQFEKL